MISGWVLAIDEALVGAHLGVASESDSQDEARRKLDALIDWHISVAMDPAVNGGYRLIRCMDIEESKYQDIPSPF